MIRSHALRAALSEEMHVRRLPRFAAPCRLMQVVTLLDEAAAAEARGQIAALASAGGVMVPEGARYEMIALDGVKLVWERHTEFASYTFVREGPFDTPFAPDHFGAAADAVIVAIPGDVIRATQIALYPATEPEPNETALAAWFATDALTICDVAGGKARVASDFRLNADGFGRLMVFDRGLARDEPAHLVLRLQELGNYRNMALLGLPFAQKLTPEVTRLEQRLAALTAAVPERVSEDDALLDELTFLSAELARLAAETRYRMSATRAYAQLSRARLESLGSIAVGGYQTLADFTERRLMPAVRTCESFSARLDDLSQRAAWTSALLRTRIDIALAKQNRDLLHSMDKRTQMQLRLQQTVEGLSVVAISYYAVALIGHLLDALPGIDHAIATAVAVPVVLIAAALFVRRLRRHYEE